LKEALRVRLQAEGAPDAVDGGGRVADRLGHRAQQPVGRAGGHRLQGQADRLGDLVVADPARRARPWLVEQSVQALGGEAAPPLRDRVGVRPDLGADRLVLEPRRRGSRRSGTVNSITTAALPIAKPPRPTLES
jgi:hypothetical protein